MELASEDKGLLGVLPAGTVLHGYEFLSVLGHGGFGITYLARHTRLGREVAIKEFLPRDLALRDGLLSVLPRSTELAGDFNWVRERFLEEARNLVRLEGVPAIVRVSDLFEANGTAYTVMALARGDTLEQRLGKTARLSAPVVDRLLWPLLDGLEQVHAMGFIHRDIKPANIILDVEDRPTLIDFGAARMAMAGRTVATMTAMYTPAYAAPEQYTTSRQGAWTDIYGLSATLYHAITGDRPPSAMERTLDSGGDSLTTRSPSGFARPLLVGIDAGMQVRPADRPQTIASWREVLRRPEASARDTVYVAKREPTVPPVPSAAASLPPPVAPSRPAAAGRLPRFAWMAVAAAVPALAAGGYFSVSMFFGPAGRSTSETTVARPERERPDTGQPDKDQAERERIAKERPDTGQPDKDQAERERIAKEKAAKEQADKEETERERIAKEQADKEEADKEEAERERIAKEKAAEEQADKDQAERERIAKEKADKERADKDQAERERIAKEKADKEQAEVALGLASIDRTHLQVALTSLGFDTRGNDGLFGPRTREMIAAWQKARQLPVTGFLTSAQQHALLREGASAVAAFDEAARKKEEPKKPIDDGGKKPEPGAKVDAAEVDRGSAHDGSYSGSARNVAGTRTVSRLTARVEHGVGAGTIEYTAGQTTRYSFSVSSTGSIEGSGEMLDKSGIQRQFSIRGEAQGSSLSLTFEGSDLPGRTIILTKATAKISPFANHP